MKYIISYEWNEKAKRLDWGIHDGINHVKRGFKTRKAARAYADEHGLTWLSDSEAKDTLEAISDKYKRGEL